MTEARKKALLNWVLFVILLIVMYLVGSRVGDRAAW
jgi:hypothetical protein